jgi:hypothetical protein
MRIVYLTDLHGVTAGLHNLIRRESGADLCLVGGDLTSFRGPPAARRVIEPLREAFGRIRAVAGNTDRHEVSAWLAEQGWSLDGRGEELEGLWLSGVEGSTHTPLRAPIEYSETELARRLEAGAPPEDKGAEPTPPPGVPLAGASQATISREGAVTRPWILVTHVPPWQTRCDRIFAGQHVGSSAVRHFLELRRPALHLCGHVHEGVGFDRVGEVTVCNPGAWTAFRYAVVTWNRDEGSCVGMSRDEERRLEGSHAERSGEPPAAPLQVELRRMVPPPLLRFRARARMMAEKVTGYARHRLGR